MGRGSEQDRAAHVPCGLRLVRSMQARKRWHP